MLFLGLTGRLANLISYQVSDTMSKKKAAGACKVTRELTSYMCYATSLLLTCVCLLSVLTCLSLSSLLLLLPDRPILSCLLVF